MAPTACRSLPVPLAVFPLLCAQTATEHVWQQEDSAGKVGQSVRDLFVWILAKEEAVSVNQSDCSPPRADLKSLFPLCQAVSKFS